MKVFKILRILAIISIILYFGMVVLTEVFLAQLNVISDPATWLATKSAGLWACSVSLLCLIASAGLFMLYLWEKWLEREN